MDIFILRHGAAQDRAEGLADADRALTPQGKRDVRNVVQAARAAKVAPSVILTSPLVRARQTAEIAAKILGKATVVETPNLLPGAPPDRIWKEIGGLKDAAQVLLAGHEPHMSRLAGFLLEAAVAIDLKKGALVRIQTKQRMGPPRGVLKWMITPRLAR